MAFLNHGTRGHVMAWVIYNPRSGGISRIVVQDLSPGAPRGLRAARMMIGPAVYKSPGTHRVRSGRVVSMARGGIGTGSLV